ncbi:alpha/beta hydrolase [Photobacterium damselae]
MNKPSILFIGGAWHGAWVWQPLSRALLDHHLLSVAFDLPGAGTLAPREYTLSGQAVAKKHLPEQSLVANITFDDRFVQLERQLISLYQATQNPVVIIAHSIGGLFASELMEKHTEKICSAIFINGYMLLDQQSAADFLVMPYMSNYKVGQILAEDYSKIQATRIAVGLSDSDYNHHLREILYGDISDDRFECALHNLHTDEPLTLFDKKISISKERFGSVNRHYISSKYDLAVPLEAQKYMVDVMDQWSLTSTTVHTIATGHSPMISNHQKLSEIIASIV